MNNISDIQLRRKRKIYKKRIFSSIIIIVSSSFLFIMWSQEVYFLTSHILFPYIDCVYKNQKYYKVCTSCTFDTFQVVQFQKEICVLTRNYNNTIKTITLHYQVVSHELRVKLSFGLGLSKYQFHCCNLITTIIIRTLFTTVLTHNESFLKLNPRYFLLSH